MSAKKDNVSTQPEVDASASASEAVEEITQNIDAEAEELDELAKALEEANELRDRHLRLKAEWDNYRKRTEAERADERSRATQRLVEKLLPIIDDVERAIEHSENASEESLKEGIAQVCSKLVSVLTGEGVKVIDPKGEPFDANRHSAISKLEDNKVPEETVLEVYQKGYEMGSRILRPAMVIVSSK
jgi:molecular chaperone GrpE